MAGVYRWMSFGILLTGATSYYVSLNKQLVMTLATNTFVSIGLFLAQIGAVIFLAALIEKISAFLATVVYLLYAFFTGLSLSFIFLVYTQESIQQVFFLTSFSFAGISFLVTSLKKDLGPLGTFCHMGLWGLIGFIFKLVFPTLIGGTMDLVISIIGVGIFAGLTAYDTQKIKEANIIK